MKGMARRSPLEGLSPYKPVTHSAAGDELPTYDAPPRQRPCLIAAIGRVQALGCADVNTET